MSKLETILKLNKIWLIRNKKNILKDFNWEVKKGEHWIVLGANGSGKTMLLKMLSGYIWPSKGEIFVLGKKFGEVDLSTLRQLIGLVNFDLQQSMQQEFEAFEVVISGYFASIGLYKKPPKEIVKRANSLIRFVGVERVKSNLFPTLSYGEQKRILIARSLISKPKLLLLDEPFSGLDLKAREKFLEFLKKLIQKKDGPTIILVTHHLEEIVPGVSHILALKNGEIKRIGKKEEVLKKGVVKDILGVNLDIIKKGERYSAHML